MRDKIDVKNAEARARDFAMHLPATKEARFLLMQKIAIAIQETHGSFFFDQIYDVLERVYDNLNEKMILTEMEEWVQKDSRIEFVGDENGFYVYRIS
tara:strand:- start:602 stop:892 length:291 start_codon:yes stop_codon:yes gene_type:complete